MGSSFPFHWDESPMLQFRSNHVAQTSHPAHTGMSSGPSRQIRNSANDPHGVSGAPDIQYTAHNSGKQRSDVNPPQRARSQTKLRPKRQRLDWESKKEIIRKLYIDDNESLATTMRIMEEEHSFVAPMKAYKTKIKAWKWSKNLSLEHAAWMTAKAKKRKREEGKETVFIYGGSKWTSEKAESSVARSTKKTKNLQYMNSDRHPDISYKTPRDRHNTQTPKSVTSDNDIEIDSPEAGNTPEDSESPEVVISREVIDIASGISSESDFDDDGGNAEHDSNEDGALCLTWQGYTKSGLSSMLALAKEYKLENNIADAESLLQKVHQGYTKMLSSTGEDTNKVAYLLATLYVENGQAEDADNVLEEVVRRHIRRWGVEDRRTQQQVLNIVELLNGWDRAADALAFLTRAWEITAESRKIARTRAAAPTRIHLADIVPNPNKELSAAQVDAALGIMRTHVQASDSSVEAYLQGILQLCDKKLDELAVQALKAKKELLSLYLKTGRTLDHSAAFEQVQDIIGIIWDQQAWAEDEFRSLEVLEASMELIGVTFKAGYTDEASRLFRRVDEMSEKVFGREDERTVWIYISIGLFFQQHGSGWAAAAQWFEQAYAAAMITFPARDGIVRSLERALVKNHFTYLSDEGRPFKTIFGVSGVVIRPGRLHFG